ncbi:MAG: serine/threonine protein kinase [Phycisphaeraceae bacterium]|nr:serine/threonine protein kinase [Phycisphaeraceae bacterium]
MEERPTSDQPSRPAQTPAPRGGSGSSPHAPTSDGGGSGGGGGSVGGAMYEDGPGSQIGPYKILQTLGEGGFGVVYLAEQRVPVERRVALKVIKLGMDSKEVLARFEAERQALALMDHANVAKFLDAGLTPTGRPYFAMEHVPGVPLTDYCDTQRLTPRERLELFVPVCMAVQHAHQKGIIHRDLKPSNILVMLQDEKPVPKVIDFGVAKAVSKRLTEKTLFTETGRMIGTPEYMSPEQAGTTGLDIDTRTDVYSLGVVLYELLAGVLPFDSKTLREAGYEGILKIIRDQDPPRLPTRLSSLGARQSDAAQKRKSDPKTLVRLLAGDLDWITQHAMEKDRTRRYQTAGDLAADVTRFLNNEPVVARPPSAVYKAGKFVRRHKFGVGAGTALAAALVLAVAGTGYGLVRALAAEKRAISERDDANRARKIAEEVNSFLERVLSAVDPSRLNKRDVTVREVLDQSSIRVLPALANEPAVESAIRNTMGRTYTALGIYDKAETQLLEAMKKRLALLPADHPDIADTKNNLGLLYRQQGRREEAQRELREALDLRTKLFGAQHAATAAVRNNLGLVERDMGRLDEAEASFAAALAAQRATLVANHPDIANTINNLAAVLQERGKYDEAESKFREAITSQRAALGQESPDVANTLGNLGEMLRQRGRFADAEPAAREALAIRRKLLGNDHPQTLASIGNVALLLQDKGDLNGAELLLREALEIARKAKAPDVFVDLLSLANLLNDKQDFAAAEPLAREALEKAAAVLPAGHAEVGKCELLLGRVLTESGRAAEGEGHLRRALDIFRAKLPAADWRIPQTESALGGCLMAQGRLDEAGTLVTESWTKIRDVLGAAHLRTRQAAERAAKWHEARGDAAKAAEIRGAVR